MNSESQNQNASASGAGGGMCPAFPVWAASADLVRDGWQPDTVDKSATGCGCKFPQGALAHPEGFPLGAVLRSRAVPAGELLMEAQGKLALAVVKAQVRALAARMMAKGKAIGSGTIEDAQGAALLAVVQWRAGQAVDGADGGLALVAWRAACASVKRDELGESVELSSLTAEGLFGSCLPLPALLGDASRADKAARLRFERARARRPALLSRRIEFLQASTSSAKRRQSFEDIGKAAGLLLQGASLDQAARGAGYKAGGNACEADRLLQSVRRAFGVLLRFKRDVDGDPARRSWRGLPSAFTQCMHDLPAPSLPGSLRFHPAPPPPAGRTVRLVRGAVARHGKGARAALRGKVLHLSGVRRLHGASAVKANIQAKARRQAPRQAKARARAGVRARQAMRDAKALGVWLERKRDGFGAWVLAYHAHLAGE